MPKLSSKAKDPNRTAFDIVQQVTGAAREQPTKNPAAVALGKLGGLKGGRARAESLSAETRAAIARKAAQARWKSQGAD